jgi:hypothetical protein
MHYRIGFLALMMVALPVSASAQKQKKEEFPAYLQSWQVERVVPKGEKRRLGFFVHLYPDCTSRGAIIVKLTGKPKSGTVTFEEIETFPYPFTHEDYKKCNTEKVPGTAVSYDPNPDFTGTDAFSGTVIYSNGQARKFEIKVSVEPPISDSAQKQKRKSLRLTTMRGLSSGSS